MKKTILLYGLLMGGLVMLLQWMDYRYYLRAISTEVYLSGVAIICTGVGIWMGLRWTRRRTNLLPSPPSPAASLRSFTPNPQALSEIGLSKREYEVLELMAEGLSNQEIADRLFISLNTVKTHSSKLYMKLEVKRRTQAVQTAKTLGLLP